MNPDYYSVDDTINNAIGDLTDLILQSMQPSITKEEEARLEQLVRDREAADREAKIKEFIKQPEEVREAILRKVMEHELEDVMRGIANACTEVSQEEMNLQTKKGYHYKMTYMTGTSTYFTHESQIPDGMPSYEELKKAHIDRSMEEIVLEDKNADSDR